MMKLLRSSSRVTMAVLLLALLAHNPLAAAQPDAAAPGNAQAPPVQGQRVFTCGHSFHAFVYRLLSEMAKAAGIHDHQNAGLSAIGGSRVIQHWDVPDEKNQAKAALRAGLVDVLTLAPIWLPDQGIDNFAQLCSEHAPGVRITVQEFWLPNDTYEPVYPLDTRKPVDHNATDLKELQKSQARYLQDLGDYVRGINRRLGKDLLCVVPVGQAALALREKIAANQAPGLKMQWDLFRDPWGHAQAPLMVLSGYCHFAVIYRRSPVGLPLPDLLRNYRRIVSDVRLRKPGWRPSPEELQQAESLTSQEQEDLNRLLQQLAWDAVARHPLSGVAPR